ncbi:MAG: MFS transporter [Phycisphaerales bacterium]|nr:MFS transporter [Phycisphaerales bacterium]
MSMVKRAQAALPSDLPAGLFLNRNFLLLWAAYGIGAMGDYISAMAVLKWMNALDSPEITRLQAMMTFMFMLPFFVLGPFAGLLADRLPRRGLMIATLLIRAVLMLNFAVLLTYFATWGTVAQFIPFLLVGIFAAVFSPARLALLPSLIREDQLIRANAMSSGLGVIAMMIAMVIGGYLAQQAEPTVSYYVNSGTFVISALLLWAMRVPAREIQRQRGSAGLAALTEAGRYVRDHRRVIQLIMVAVIIYSCGAVVRSVMPAVVRDAFERPDYVQIAGFQARLGGGILLGALILTLFGNALRSEVAISWSLAGIGAAISLLTFSVFSPFAANVNYHIGGLAVIAVGVFGAGALSSYHVLIQRTVPDRLRGRVFGLTDLASMAGLLLVTGLIGIPRWPSVDNAVGWILLATSILVCGSAVMSFRLRIRYARFPRGLNLWWRFNEFYCKWWFRLKREGICTVPTHGPVIVVANHTSSIDPLLLIASTPNRVLGFVVAEEYANLPIGGRFIRMIECVPVKRDGHDAAGTRAALRHLRAGKALGVFPEGRIVRPDETLEPKDGAVLIALHTNALIVPAYISGTVYDSSVSRAFFRRHRARVRFGRPIDLSRYWIDRVDKESLGKLSQMVMRRIRELGEDDSLVPWPE